MKYQVYVCGWAAKVGDVDQYGGNFISYWTSKLCETRDEAIALLEAHEEVIKYDPQLLRYEMKKDYTRGDVFYRKILVSEFEGV